MKKLYLSVLMLLSCVLGLTMFSVNASPYSSIYDFTYDTAAYTNVGWTDDVQISSDLDYYSSGDDNLLVYYSPTTQATNTSYNVGLGLTASPTGFGGGITAGTTFVNRDLDILNQSNSPELHYGVDYIYNEDINPLWVWLSTTYFVTETFQYGMYIVKNPVSKSYFSNVINITTRFEANAGITKLSQVTPDATTEETSSYYFSHIK